MRGANMKKLNMIFHLTSSSLSLTQLVVGDHNSSKRSENGYIVVTYLSQHINEPKKESKIHVFFRSW